METKGNERKKSLVYVLTMTDRENEFNNGVENAVFSTKDKAVAQLLRWVAEEIRDSKISEADLKITYEDFVQTRDGRLSWTVDEREVL